MFDSPIHFCPLCREWVPLDVSVAECAARHGCRPDACPLAEVFRIARAAGAPTHRDGSTAAGGEDSMRA